MPPLSSSWPQANLCLFFVLLCYTTVCTHALSQIFSKQNHRIMRKASIHPFKSEISKWWPTTSSGLWIYFVWLIRYLFKSLNWLPAPNIEEFHTKYRVLTFLEISEDLATWGLLLSINHWLNVIGMWDLQSPSFHHSLLHYTYSHFWSL